MIPLSYSARSLWQRKTTTVMTGAGLALVVFVFTAARMLEVGLAKTLVETGTEGNAIVIRRASQSEIQSVILRKSTNIVLTQPEIAPAADGSPLGAAEAVVLINLPKRSTGEPSNVAIRGVSARSLEIRDQVRIVEGRMFEPGKSEVIAGRPIAERFQGCQIGERLRFGQREWEVVGLFDAGGSAFDSEVWGDSDQLQQAYRRQSFSSVTVRLRTPGDLEALEARLEADPRLTVDVLSEREYYAKQTETMSVFIGVLGRVISTLFSLGAIVGAMITMYAAVANRVSEIGTLRALGFRRRHVLLAFLFESILLATVSGAIGIALASGLQTVSLSTTNWDTFSEVAFRFAITPQVVGGALAFSLLMGILGGVLPAVRAARLQIVTALRTA